MNRAINPNLYSIFNLDLIHNPFLWILKFLKHLTIHDEYTNTLLTKKKIPQKNQLMFILFKAGVRRWFKYVLSELQKYCVILGLKVDFLSMTVRHNLMDY